MIFFGLAVALLGQVRAIHRVTMRDPDRDAFDYGPISTLSIASCVHNPGFALLVSAFGRGAGFVRLPDDVVRHGFLLSKGAQSWSINQTPRRPKPPSPRPTPPRSRSRKVRS